MKNDPDILGLMATDRITGFRGRITAIVRYISGCVQACVTPEINDDKKLPDGHFFDVQRLAVELSGPRLLLDNVPAPGHDAPPPTRDKL